MSLTNLPEVWMRGPIHCVPSLLQPVAHALLQAKEEINELAKDLDEKKLWLTPAGAASPAFNLQHIPGVLDRLFTYANNNQLTQEQLQYLSEEGKYNESITVTTLVENLNHQIDATISQLKTIAEETLTEVRFVGRKKLPSTVLGLIFHSAEHTMRHLGQLLVTVKVLRHQQ